MQKFLPPAKLCPIPQFYIMKSTSAAEEKCEIFLMKFPRFRLADKRGRGKFSTSIIMIIIRA